ncbi:MAG: class I SAM-dependent methyltransferase [Bacteroidales bacterium]
MIKNSVSALLRSLGLLFWSDYLVYLYKKVRYSRDNKRFLQANPGVVLPPDYLIYESFQLDYKKYYTDSIESARWLAGLFKKYSPVYNINILDWGCGPARIIRHLPSMIGNSSVFFGTDYNTRTIDWCRKNIPGVTFSVNGLEPPLDYNNQLFHIIYGISIFTHLSEPLHKKWIDELHRVLVPGGILLFTTQGEAFRSKLSAAEISEFNQGRLVVRGNVKEGHRTFSAFQPEKYMIHLLDGFEILEHIEGENTTRPQQDIWIVKKRSGQ